MATTTRQCANCGFENLGVARFCANCGRPLGETPGGAVPIITAETRRTITTVFFDLVGSTGLTERLDPEESRAVVSRFYDAVQGVVDRFDGAIANLLGDGVLAVFGLPTSHEDDPERAVRAALAMKEAMLHLNADLAGAYGIELGVRAGISTGEVVAASGSTFDRDFLISDAVTTAARIQQAAAPGAVVVTERTHRLTRGAIAYHQLPPLEAKGKRLPLQVWEALSPLPEQMGRAGAGPFVGREPDLALLRGAFARTAAEALGHRVTILGEAGVGKSRLLLEFLNELRDGGVSPMVLRGRSPAFGGQIGYHALLQILRDAGGLLDTDAPEVVREKLDRWVRAQLPEQVGLLDGLMLTFGGLEAGADPGRQRAALFDAWRQLVGGLAARRPVVLVFEDVHWADEGLLDLIESMTREIGEATLLIACLGRSELLDRRPEWGAGARNALILDLQPLAADQMTRLAGSLAGGALSEDVARRIAERADGNPLFAEELVRMLTEGATGASAGGPVIPDTVQAVVTARIDRLPADERRALQAAAVVGRTFWTSAVAQLSGLAVDDAARVIEALVRKDLIFAHRQSAIADERELAFRHILTRDVAYGMLPRAQRQRAHAEAARWLEARLGERIEESIEILAEHLRVAGDDPRAAVYLRRAAGKARRLYANADAIRLYDQTLEVARRANLTADLPQLYLERGDVHELRGTYPAALADFETALAAAQEAGNTALEAALENRIGRIHHREARLDEAERHFQRAAELARLTGDRMTLGLALVDLATVAWDRGDNPAADRILAEGAGILRQERDDPGLARALNLRGMVHMAMGDLTPAVAAVEEALDAARRAGDRAREATSQSYLGIIHQWAGRPRIGLEHCKASLALAEAIGDRRRATYAAEFMATIDAVIGEWGEGLRLGEGLLPTAAELTPQELPYVYMFLGQTYEEIGDHTRAVMAYRDCTSLGRVNPAWQQMLLIATALAARIEGDQAELNRTIDAYLALPLEPFLPNAALGTLLLADALLHGGRIEDARTLLQMRRGLVERLGNPGFNAGVALLEAYLATSDGAHDAAATLLDEAVPGAQEAENVSVLRRALELRVTLFNRSEDRRALGDLLRRLAASLPDDLRAIFLASPRVAPHLA